MKGGDARRAGMTFIEFLLACALAGLLLAGAAGLYDHYLDKSKIEAARSLIAALARAASLYHESTGAYPPGRIDAGCDRALIALHASPRPAQTLKGVSGPWLAAVNGLPRCVDPWGREVRYLTDLTEVAAYRRRLIQNGGVPIFESAGPDRDFGDSEPGDQSDNIRSDEPS
jgi:type II secretory pathway pseudopilin PulG